MWAQCCAGLYDVVIGTAWEVFEVDISFFCTGYDSDAVELDAWPIKVAIGRSVENTGPLLIYYTSLGGNSQRTFELCFASTGKCSHVQHISGRLELILFSYATPVTLTLIICCASNSPGFCIVQLKWCF